MFRYERRHQALASPQVFYRRIVRSSVVGLVLILVSLIVGMAGYAGFEGLDILDSFVNAAMILSGMGPLHSPMTPGGKVFAGVFALYSGLAVLAIAAVIFAPILHRLMHRFHLEEEADAQGKANKRSAKPGSKR